MTVDHVAVALSRLPQIIKDLPNFQVILTALIQPFQDLEDVFQVLLLNRGVLTATGVTLTGIGNLVGEPRASLADVEYRRRIRARIATNRSNGTIDDLLRITQLILYDDAITIQMVKQAVGVVVVRLAGAVSDDTITILLDFLRAAVSADGRVIVESSTLSEDRRWRLDVDVFDDTEILLAGARD